MSNTSARLVLSQTSATPSADRGEHRRLLVRRSVWTDARFLIGGARKRPFLMQERVDLPHTGSKVEAGFSTRLIIYIPPVDCFFHL